MTSGFPCPSCDEVLNTERGKKQHHTKIHNEPLPNRTCKDCGGEFYDPKSMNQYCNSCNSREGKKNPNFKNAKSKSKCEVCGEEFEYYPSDKEGIYCSDCQEESVIKNNLISQPQFGENNPNWSGGKTQISCDFCEEEFKRYDFEINNSEFNFCSPSCQNKWLKGRKDIDIRSLFNENTSEKSIDKWFQVRREVLKRDNFSCQVCQNDKFNFNHVHHLIPKDIFENENEAHYKKNCITLCVSCHTTVENGKQIIPDEVINQKGLEEPRYNLYSKNNE